MSQLPTKSDPFGFPKTRWDLVVEAQGSEKARNELLTLYNGPVFAYFRALTRDRGAAEELRQSFFVTELTRLTADSERGVIRRADQNKGRFRDFLKTSLRNHWLSSLRGTTNRPVSLDESANSEADENLEAKIASAENAFLGNWARQVISDALRAVEQTCHDRNQVQHFDLFMAHYFPPAGADTSWEILAKKHGYKDGKTARNRAETVLNHFRPIFSKTLLGEGPSGASLNEEIRDLLKILGDDNA